MVGAEVQLLTDRSSWKVVRFGDAVENVNVHERDPMKNGLSRYVGLEHLSPDSLRIETWGEIADGTSFTKKFTRGQVLFPKRRVYQRKFAYTDFEGLCSGDILVLQPKDDRLIPELLPFIVQTESFISHALDTSAGSLSPRTRWRDLTEYEFALPPKPVQERIATLLLSSESYMESLAQAEDKLSRLRVAVTRTLDEKSNGEKVPIGKLATMDMGKVFPSQDYSAEGIRLLRPGNLASDGSISWSPDATTYLPESYLDANPHLLVAPRDVVINLTAQSLEDGFMGRVCLVREGDDALLNQRIGLFRLVEEVLPEYFFRILQGPRFRRWAETRCEGSKIRHLHWRHLKDFEIPVPPLADQRVAVRTMNAVDRALSLLRSQVGELRRLMKFLMEATLPKEGGE